MAASKKRSHGSTCPDHPSHHIRRRLVAAGGESRWTWLIVLVNIGDDEWMSLVDNLIELVVGAVRGVVPEDAGWAVMLARRTMEYLLGPVRDLGGRFHWLALLAALVLAGLVFAFGPPPPAASPAEAPPAGTRLGAFLRFCFPRRVWFNRSTWVDIQVSFVNFVYSGYCTEHHVADQQRPAGIMGHGRANGGVRP